VRNRKTYEELIEVKSLSYRRLTKISLNNFERFTGEPIGKTISRIKDDEDEVFDTLNRWIAWNSKNGVTDPRQYFGFVNLFFYYMKIKLSPRDVLLNIVFGKKHHDELHALKLEEIKKLLDVMPYWKKALYIAKISSGMRENEICNIRKKDLDLSTSRITVRIPAKYTKTKEGRTTFISSEAANMILPKLKNLNENDRVWSSASTASEGKMFTGYVDKAGFGNLRYETTGKRKINTHCLRAYFITKVSRYDRDLALILAGQGSKATEIEYDRLSPEEKLDLYMKIEPQLIIDSTARDKIALEKKDKEISDLRKSQLEIKKLQRKQEETSIRLAEINEKIVSDYNQKLDDKKELDGSDMELIANVIRSRMELDPEFSSSFKRMVNEDPKISIEKKKRIGAI